MPKFYSSEHIIKVLQSKGFVFISQIGMFYMLAAMVPVLYVMAD